jgi:hypothetical protein
MFSKPTIAILSAARLLFRSRRALALLLASYCGLLAAVYLFVSTREATIFQLLVTITLVVIAPALFFVFQALSVNYANDATSVRKISSDCLKLIVVSLPVLAVTLLALYGLNKLQASATLITTFRYLLLAVIAPLLAIQIWVATSTNGMRSLVTSLRKVAARAFAPQSVFVYACGFLIFAVVPYFLVSKTVAIQRAWLELSVLILRLSASALLILVGWVTTVGAISILSRNSYSTATGE